MNANNRNLVRRYLVPLCLALSIACYNLAWAATAETETCTSGICNGDGIPVLIVEAEDDSLYQSVERLSDVGRVDLYGEYTTRLRDGGVIWLTEDPAQPKPRLAIRGPSHLPVEQGKFAQDTDFIVHTNYASYLSALKIEVFRERDTDRRTPIASLTTPILENQQLYYTVPWALEGQKVPTGTHLVYRLTALDAEGRQDQTLEQRAFFVKQAEYQEQLEELEGFSTKAYTMRLVSVDDGVVLFVPGEKRAERIEVRPTFSSLEAKLTPQDKQKIDAAIGSWSRETEISLEVTGHTSSVPIARRNRHIFADNYALSRARARAVANYLTERLGSAISYSRAEGHGADYPVATNDTAEGQALNRRAEIALTGTTRIDPKVLVVDRETKEHTNFDEIRRVVEIRQHQAMAKPSADLDGYAALISRNDLSQRRIPIYGSRVRVHGNNIGAENRVWLNGEQVRLDTTGAFVAEFILPLGQHQVDLHVADINAVHLETQLPVDITGRYAFMVGLADFTMSENDVSGSVEPLAANDRYEEDMLVEGRMAFYLKGKVKGKYLMTAQLDTREEQLDNLFSEIHKKDPDSLFRRLDPDRYYPVYGDDSTTVADVNTQGRMYVRVEWDRSEVSWGNFETGMTGNEVTQYSRGLYGASAKFESLDATEYEESKTYLSAFVSENQTALGHSEFLGTGGSLYYLRHTDILPGSDKLRIEIRDPDTNRVLENQLLSRQVDYEIDEIQGRVILSKPLLQTSQSGAPSLILEGPLDGNLAILVADYEYLPNDFDADQVVYGMRGKRWLGDHLAIGATYVNEGRVDEDYTLAGLDLTLQAAKDTYMKLEWGTSEATQTSRFFSTNGGLNFNNLSPLGTDNREGDAYNLDLHINAGDFGGNDEWTTNAWYKEVDDQFSVARRDDGANAEEYGVETQLPLNDRWTLASRASVYELDGQFRLTEYGVQVEGKLSSKGILTSELKQRQEERSGVSDLEALLLALQYEHALSEKLSLYATGQTTLSKSGGYQDNQQIAIGSHFSLTERTSGQVELRDGDRGNGALASLEHRLTDRLAVYGTASHSTDSTNDPFARSDNGASMLDNVGTNFAVGQRWRMSERSQLFTERQFSRNDEFSGVGNVFGLDYGTKSGWNLGMTLQDGDLTLDTGIVERKSYTLSSGYQGRAARFSTKLEFRDDRGAEDIEQWLSSSRFDYKLSETYRLAAKLNYSESDDATGRAEDAKLIEGSIGLARRPVTGNRLNWLTKYTYLHDLQSFGQQFAETDQRSHVASAEATYRMSHAWSAGAKAARRVGEVRLTRNQGPWFESTANFGAVRLRWHRIRRWDAMAEYRWLQVEEADSERGGFLVALNRHVADNFKIGVGYNFTNFSDDLTNLDYDHQGWFLNVLGKY